MSNETKRDVLKKALDFFVMYGIEQSINYDLKRYQYLSEYDAALPDDLPVIPKAVGEWLEWCKGRGYSLIVALDSQTRVDQDTFARAWVLGVWRVEETGEIVKVEAEK
ncbi:hypothetical protein FAM18126_02328 [Lacticaseibacillus paracasei]|uniref:hypothetical protein n=1 Tax=Lacticaseibacillus paracasei TaxID=1597 RepID=UPI000FF3AF79|nr:hypothetical protein [Lacticaseibacillus paracasei]RND64410.1 hypothetical protein FAM18126_02328 [Lacticaseibacillus paracasei]